MAKAAHGVNVGADRAVLPRPARVLDVHKGPVPRILRTSDSALGADVINAATELRSALGIRLAACQRSARQGDHWRVHHAVIQLEQRLAGVCVCHNPTCPLYFRWQWYESCMHMRDLRRVNAQLATETKPARTMGIGEQAVGVSRVGRDTIHWRRQARTP